MTYSVLFWIEAVIASMALSSALGPNSGITSFYNPAFHPL
jgi:hypothetical protein